MTEHGMTRKSYVIVWAALLGLLVLTAALDYVDLGPFTIVVTLGIAGAKALLIVLYFMHLRFNTRLVWLFAAAGFVWLSILFGLTASDYLTRGWLPIPGK